jgi:hypothetical protein
MQSEYIGGKTMEKSKCDECGAEIDTGNEQITLRDHFAGLFMNAFLSGKLSRGNLDLADEEVLVYIAESAYEMADAMIKERNK